MLVPWFDVDAAFAELDGLSRQLDALLGQTPDGRSALRTLDGASSFVKQEDGGFVWTGDFPGASRDDVHVTVENGLLTVQAKRDWTVPDGFTARYTERRPFEFTRTLRLADSIDADGITATFDNGSLTVRLPVRPKTQPRQIEVQS